LIEGKCPKCGKQYWGWSLKNPRNQCCVNCGIGLIIMEDGKTPQQGYSPFVAAEYKVPPAYQTLPESEKGKLLR
jgi:DNA-directed RNA polymerase subunit RPC12/RpoP